MPGLVDSTDGLEFGAGLNWLDGGLGDPGLVNPPTTLVVTDAGIAITTDADDEITTG